jgi:hypothetical protein
MTVINARPNLPSASPSASRERLAADAEITAYIHAISERHRPTDRGRDQAPEESGDD